MQRRKEQVLNVRNVTWHLYNRGRLPVTTSALCPSSGKCPPNGGEPLRLILYMLAATNTVGGGHSVTRKLRRSEISV